MAVEVVGKMKRVFEYKGKEYDTVDEVKSAMLFDELGPEPVAPDQLLGHSVKLVDILRYAGRKQRAPRPPGWVPPVKTKRGPYKKKAKAEKPSEPEATA
jgi:hypothetical protein